MNSCDLFVFTENLLGKTKDDNKKQSINKLSNTTKQSNKIDLPINIITKAPIDINNLFKAYDQIVNNNQSVSMSIMVNSLREIDPTFSAKNYGSSTMSKLFKRLPNYFKLVGKDNNLIILKK